ncbi:diguanylate cyclase domain-containing protein [Agrilutibacter solisilvae]|uniref:Diguanylate cyclase n=1 Tax=Agrilutibacter solisilvae TaxID=2763317 RepID=A0A974XWM0_9GAMM|nr:diguanylate cyclase [Lysobacter solisilvae]QSX77068.1 diguanylate cyclase [Lysobacter solisilvae]
MERFDDASTEGDAASLTALRAQLAEARHELAGCRAHIDRVRSALQALPDGVVVVDAQGLITDINLGAVHLTGWAESDCIGQALHEVVRLRDSQGRQVDLLAPRTNDAVVTTLVRRDEHQVLIEATLTPLFDTQRPTVPTDVQALEPPIGWVLAFRNVTAARRITDELTYHATHDALTGVLNRRALESRLKRAVINAQEHGTPHALLYLDLDRFKAVNDNGGHFAGDELLRTLSALLQRSLRDHDTLARLGGDEFAMLLTHCTPSEARVVAKRIRAAISEFRFPWQGQEFDVGASIGMVTFRNGALAPRALLLRADEMCYLAKANGRNQVQVIAAERPIARSDAPRKRPAVARR